MSHRQEQFIRWVRKMPHALPTGEAMHNRAVLRELIQLPGAPIEVRDFPRTYRLARIAANTTALVGALTLGPLWADRAWLVLPVIAGLAALLLVDSLVRPDVSWQEMSRLDTPAYMMMFVMMGATAAIPFVAVTQSYIGFLFVPPRRAVRTTAIYSALGVVGVGASHILQLQILSPVQYLFLIAVATLLTVGPATWILLVAAGEIVQQRAVREALAAEKDELLLSKDRFVASISHELRTPLTSVVGLAHSLSDPEENFGDQERRELMALLVRESEEVTAIVEDLLVAARAQSGQLALSIESLPLAPEVESVVAAAGIAEIRLELAPVVVLGDPIRVRQVVRNLISNAARYGGPNVTVRVGSDAGRGILSVRDNGGGIPPERLEAVFSAYGRAHDRPGQTDPVGLGLTVSRELARLMHGDVDYRRERGWTTFSLSLPLATAHRQSS